ncbi:SGNH/GDSL hydrolase family protein [Streptomyces hesseae]|uniref:SGNH/GDSL hydrolase family protein n=1 Tax=Streptomyces hesseae TaxID=3075519 RepID=A0ABU2SNB6_9ACTN|nr:SGNH/GDSL hydrolase family protein [Streptomyces sp. DSM 40473]MDT0450473.1 SGNH/GDSL hydrolase family protein [Streptomyces sp. DSM 40473]
MNRPPLSRGAAHALLAALAALVVAASLAIFTGVGGADGTAGEARRSQRPAAPAAAGRWIGSWSASPAAAEPGTARGYPGRSIRNVVHTTLAGGMARVQLSNLFGGAPLTVDHASLALAATPGGPAAAPGGMRELTFGGERSVTVPAGRATYSDPVRLPVGAPADLLISTYVSRPAGPVTIHPHARQISYLAPGDRTLDAGGAAFTAKSLFWRYVTAVDVWTAEATGAVVALGDSITDGVSATIGADRRWTDFLAARLRTEHGAPRLGVLNEGISGNRVLLGGMGSSAVNNPSALDRFDRDVLSRSGVRAVVVELGVNDILRSPRQTDPARIAAGLRTLVERAHTRGLRVTGATLSPFGGRTGTGPDQELVRRGLNAEIRSGRVFDDVVDFDRTLRDPADPQRLLPAYDCGDHLHPNDAGYLAMARTLDVGTLKGEVRAAL